MRDFAKMTNPDVWYAHADLDQLRAEFDSQLKKRQRKMVDTGMAKARTQQMDRTGVETQMSDLLAKYRRTLETDRRFLLQQFEYADMARKVVGVGSVGTRCWIILMLGRNESDPLFLQVKEVDKSVLAAFAGASKYTNQGQRVVAGQRLMQASSDIFLGWQRIAAGPDGEPHDFYVCQLRDWKYSIAIEDLVPRHADLRRGLRVGAGAGARLLRGPDRHCRLPGRLGRVRPGHHPVRRRLRRPERTRPQIAHRCRRLMTDNRRTRHVRSRSASSVRSRRQ